MFLSCGDSLFDVFMSTDAGQNYEDDPAQSRVELAGNAGGSPMNVAVGLARLGHESHFLTKISSDLFGTRLRRFLEYNNVNSDFCINTDLNTTLAVVETARDGSANYVFYTKNTADVSIAEGDLAGTLPSSIKVLHFGSYSTVVNPTASSLKFLADRESNNVLVSYDPNLRTSIEPDIDKWRESFAAFASCAGLIKASDEDIEGLYGPNKEDQFVADCFNHGAQLVYITRGPMGASGYQSSGQSVHTEGVKVSVVDTVGAGDTFQAAIIHWLVSNRLLHEDSTLSAELDLTASIEFALRAAAVTCSRGGANLPYLSELSLSPD